MPKFWIAIGLLATLSGCNVNEAHAEAESARAFRLFTSTMTPLREDASAALIDAGLPARAVSNARAAELAEAATRTIFADVRARAGRPSYAQGLQAEYAVVLADLMSSANRADRLAIVSYLHAPLAANALNAFSTSDSAAAVRRLAILAHPVAPRRALLAYWRLYELQPEPFVLWQMEALQYWTGEQRLARESIAMARARWPKNEMVEARALIDEAELDAYAGISEGRDEKLRRAADLAIKNGDKVIAAVALSELGDVTVRRGQRGDLFIGGDDIGAKPVLLQALNLAEQTKTYTLVDDIYQNLANTAQFSPGYVPYMEMAVAAAEQTGYSARLAAASEKTAEALSGSGDTAKFEKYVALMERAAQKLGDPRTLFKAQKIRMNDALERHEFKKAHELVNAWRMYSLVGNPTGGGDLYWYEGKLAKAEGNRPLMCQLLKKSHARYQSSGQGNGTAYTESALRGEGCELGK